MRSLLILLMGSTMALADPAPNQSGALDCFCTDRSGARIELGQEICLFVDDRAFMARCEMSQNNPMWRPTGQACLSSGLHQSLKPAG